MKKKKILVKISPERLEIGFIAVIFLASAKTLSISSDSKASDDICFSGLLDGLLFNFCSS